MKIGLVQNNILWENKQFNLNSSKDIFKRAKASNIDLLLFPELSFVGFSMRVDTLCDLFHETINYISSLCKNYSINAGIGYILGNTHDNKGKNNYVLINSQGNVLCEYTKIHPFSMLNEDDFYEKGSSIVYGNIDTLTVCPFICYDLRFPEIFQIASKKSDLITVAANWPHSRKEQWISLLKARAIETQCYVAGINRVGLGNKIVYSGNSIIVDPLGNVLAYGEDGVEDLIVADISRDVVHNVRKDFPFKKDRREDLYLNL